MAAPSYTTDLTLLDAADATTNWTAIGTGAISAETDYFVEGSACISKVGWTAATRGMIANSGSDRASLFGSSLNCYIAWVEYHNPNLLDTTANGGIQLIIGSGTGAYKQYAVSGSEKIPLGGWHPFVVDPNVASVFATTGSPTAVQQYFGVLAKVLGSGSLKGNPIGVDVIRIGREARCEFGDLANGYATLAGLESYGNSSASGRRWGLVTNREGAYFMQGALVLGTATNAVDFRDSDRVLFILDTPLAAAGFNEVIIKNASSRVDWTRYTLKALGTQSPGKFTVNDNADVNFDSCNFVGMGAFVLKANTQFLNCVLIQCGQVTAPGSDLTGTKINLSTAATDTGALVWNVATSPNGLLDNMSFTKGTNAHHAIEFGTSAPTTMQLTGITYSGFSGADGNNDSTLLFPDTGSNVTWNVTISGGHTPTYKKARSGDTVNIISGAVTVAVNVKDTNGSNIDAARVILKATAGGPFPVDVTVTIVNSGTTATVTHTGHGMATNDYVMINGASHYQNNGPFQITVTDANTYTYTMGSAPGSSPTGTIKSTFLALYGLTNASGNLSTTRVYSSSQPISGWARKSSSAPYYRTGAAAGTVSNTTGFSANIQLILDQ